MYLLHLYCYILLGTAPTSSGIPQGRAPPMSQHSPNIDIDNYHRVTLLTRTHILNRKKVNKQVVLNPLVPRGTSKRHHPSSTAGINSIATTSSPLRLV